MSDPGRTPERRKKERRDGDRRVAESAIAKLAAAPSDQGFTPEQPYTQRKLVVVVPNEVVVCEPAANEGLKRKASAKDRAAALIAALEESAGSGAPLSPGVVKTIRCVMALREAGVELRMVAALDAAKHLTLPPGHPLHSVVYVGHPGVPDAYYPLGDFHLKVFEDKFNEAVDLVMALGASKVSVVREEGLDPSDTQGISTALAELSNSSALFQATFPGSTDPLMPKGMVWWKHERSWQTLARARIRHNTKEFSLKVRYESDYGINEQLRQRIEAAGLEIGGRFHAQVNTVWKLNVEFPPDSDADNEPQTAAAEKSEAKSGTSSRRSKSPDAASDSGVLLDEPEA